MSVQNLTYQCDLCDEACEPDDLLAFFRDDYGEHAVIGVPSMTDHHVCLKCAAAIQRLLTQLQQGLSDGSPS